jgi:hypothetical protein
LSSRKGRDTAADVSDSAANIAMIVMGLVILFLSFIMSSAHEILFLLDLFVGVDLGVIINEWGFSVVMLFSFFEWVMWVVIVTVLFLVQVWLFICFKVI